MSRYEQEVCDELYRALPMSIAASAVLAVTLVSIQSTLVSAHKIFLWSTAMIAVLIWRISLVFIHRRFASSLDLRKCLMLARVSAAATGLVWAVSPILLLPPNDITSQAFLSFVLAGVSAGALISFQMDRLSALGFTIPTMLSLISLFVLEGTPVSRAMGLMVFIYLLFYMVSSHRSARQLKEKFHLQDLLITDQEKLRANEARLRSVLQTVPDMIFVTDGDGCFIECFDHPDLLMPPEVVLQNTVRTALPPQVAELAMTAINETLSNGVLNSFEYDLDSQGRCSSYEARVKNINSDRVLIVVRNITRQKLAETHLAEQKRLMSIIADVQGNFIDEVNKNRSYSGLLNDVLDLTGSEYGFIAEVIFSAAGDPYLKTYTITDIAWNSETKAVYDSGMPEGMEFHNLNSLFGAALTTGECVIANDPYHDPRRGGLPDGHPPLNAFLAIPIHYKDKLVALIGLANRPGGYDQALVDFLEPLTSSLGQLVTAAKDQLKYQAGQKELAKLSQVASQTTNGVVITDEKGKVQWVNEGFTRLTGFNLDEIIGRKPGEFLQGPKTEPTHLKHIASSLSKGDGFEIDLVNYTKQRHPYWVHIQCNPLLDEHGVLKGFIAIQSDITEAKEATQALQASEARLRALFRLSPVGIALNDLETGQFIDFNRTLLRPTGYTPTELSSLSYWDLTPEQYWKEEKILSESLGKTGTYGPYEKEFIRKDGSRYPVLLNGVVIRDKAGRQLIWSIVEDISERKRMEQAKDEFIAKVSHELRTPLTAINGALGLMAAGATGTTPDHLNELIELAMNNSQRLRLLIDDLLDMETLHAGKVRMDMKAQSLLPLVKEAMADIQMYADNFEVDLVLDALEEVPAVLVDSDRFLQVLANLLSNAIKFSPQGGVVLVSIVNIDEVVMTTVTDQGPGIPKEFETHVFEKFSQGDHSQRLKQRGTGLGLAISKELVDLMGGTIGFDSTPGEGASFYVKFPMLEKSELF